MRKWICKLLGIHELEGTGVEETFFTDEGSIPYNRMEKFICKHCGKEEWL